MRKWSQIKRRFATLFNKYFVNVANSPQYSLNFPSHPSIEKIMENNPSKDPEDQFSFKLTTETYVRKVISSFNIRKSTGVDKISAKILKVCVSTVNGTISNLIKSQQFKKNPFKLEKGASITSVKEKCIAAILMDLSQTFYCLPMGF